MNLRVGRRCCAAGSAGLTRRRSNAALPTHWLLSVRQASRLSSIRVQQSRTGGTCCLTRFIGAGRALLLKRIDMPQHFEQELVALKEMLLTMASHAESAVTRAVQAVAERDDDLARQVKEDDSLIDQFEIDIDEAAVNLLAKAPLATDLRLITVAMKVSLDLERVGDEATTISRRSLELSREAPLTLKIDIPGMAGIALSMLNNALDAFVNRKNLKAREVIPHDKEVDELNKRLHRELVGCMTEKPETIGRCLNFMVISKSLERIADHATNIAEEVVYLYEALDIRHTGKGAAVRHA